MNKKTKKILSYFLINKKDLIILIGLTIVMAVIGAIEPFIDSKFISALTKVDYKIIIICGLILYVFDVSQRILFLLINRYSTKYTSDVEINIQKEITEELFKLEYSNFTSKGTDFFKTRAIDDSKDLVASIVTLRYVLLDIITSLGVIIFVFTSSVKIFVFMIVGSFILFLIKIKEREVYENKYKNRREIREEQKSSFIELIRGIKDIKVLNLRKTMTKRIIDGQNRIKNIRLDEEKDSDIYSAFSAFVRETFRLGCLLYSLYLVYNQELSAGALITINLYEQRVFALVNNISCLYDQIKDIKLSLANISDILDNPEYSKENYGSIEKKKFDGLIEFKDVKFGYDENLVLNKMSFKIEPNQTIGIVGASGSGKTTIFNLISKLYTVNYGEILIDGININDFNEESLRGNISVISQEPYMFNMSIKENIKIVNPTLSDKKIKEICKMVNLDDYISNLENKYDTLIGENGIILSGGLKQRLAIARSLAKNAEIILLDEATSSLDGENQLEVMETIKNINKEYTILIIAHRLSTIIDCDKILVLNNGQVAGFDTHDNLIKNNKIYQNLYRTEYK